MLSQREKQSIINRLPYNEKSSYDVILHKKVYADLFMIQPKGKKSYLWFTYVKDTNVCIILKLNKHGNVEDLEIYPACFDSTLSMSRGTLLIGTHFVHNNKHFFASENVLVHKGTDVSKYSFHMRIMLMKEIYTNHISQKSYNNRFITIGLPCWCQNYAVALKTAETLPYPVYGIKVFDTQNRKESVRGIYLSKNKQSIEGLFRVVATVQADIYHLYCFDRNNTSPYATAAVPSYSRSVALNSLFRNIKENSNLDLLEESDDEEEFENIDEYKFVDTNKSIVMRCIYHKNFRKWEPVEVCPSNSKLITRQNAIQKEKKV